MIDMILIGTCPDEKWNIDTAEIVHREMINRVLSLCGLPPKAARLIFLWAEYDNQKFPVIAVDSEGVEDDGMLAYLKSAEEVILQK
jgi:hypothetical protein